MNDAQKALAILEAVTLAIREAQRIPAGTLYAMLMPHGCTLPQYERLERTLLDTGLVTKEGHELIWQEPAEVKAGAA